MGAHQRQIASIEPANDFLQFGGEGRGVWAVGLSQIGEQRDALGQSGFTVPRLGVAPLPIRLQKKEGRPHTCIMRASRFRLGETIASLVHRERKQASAKFLHYAGDSGHRLWVVDGRRSCHSAHLGGFPLPCAGRIQFLWVGARNQVVIGSARKFGFGAPALGQYLDQVDRLARQAQRGGFIATRSREVASQSERRCKRAPIPSVAVGMTDRQSRGLLVADDRRTISKAVLSVLARHRGEMIGIGVPQFSLRFQNSPLPLVS